MTSHVDINIYKNTQSIVCRAHSGFNCTSGNEAHCNCFAVGVCA